MASTVLCRGIPLFSIPVSGGRGGDRGGPGEGLQGCMISVHQLSVELWQRFDTPRASVQRKIQDLKIRLSQCTRPQVDFLRENGVIDSFRATTICLGDAVKLCDALKHSREKRGLSKHPLKPRDQRDGGKRRAEELWVLRLSAKKKNQDLDGSTVVDRCASIGSDEPPPTPSVAPPEIAARELGEVGSQSESPPPSDLVLEALLVADQQASLSSGEEHAVGLLLREEFSAASSSSYSTDTLKSLEALDLCAERSGRMATLRSQLSTSRIKSSSSGSTGNLCVQSSPRCHQHHHHRQNLHPPTPPTPMDHARATKRRSLSSRSALLNGHSVPQLTVTTPREASTSSYLHSPELLSEGEEEEEEVVVPRRELRRGVTSRGPGGIGRKRGRFKLFLSSDDDEEEEEVIVVKVECQSPGGDVKDKDKQATGDSSLNPCPQYRRVVTTKLRHFAKTTSPTTASSSSSFPSSSSSSSGKHLPLGTSSTHPHANTTSCPGANSSGPSSRPYADATPTTTHADTLTHISSHPHTTDDSMWVKIPRSVLIEPHAVTPPKPQVKKRGRGRPPNKPRPMSSFATMKRARSSTPQDVTLACPPSKRSRPGDAIGPAKRTESNLSLHQLAKIEKTIRRSNSETSLNGSLKDAEATSSPKIGTTMASLSQAPSKGALTSSMASASSKSLQAENSPPSTSTSRLSKQEKSAMASQDSLPPSIATSSLRSCSRPIPPHIQQQASDPAPDVGGMACSRTPHPLVNGTDRNTSVLPTEDDGASITSSSSLSHENSAGAKRGAKFTQDASSQRSSQGVLGQKLSQPAGGHRSSRDTGGQRSLFEGGTFKFDDLFGYCPPKLVVQDGDLCPEHSLSLGGLERSELSSLPPTHYFWRWTLGQPTNKGSAPANKTSSRRKNKSK